MTAIVGVVDKSSIWIGADSAASNLDYGFTIPVKEEKIFQVGEFLFGVCGSFRVRDLLRHYLVNELAIQHQEESDESFIHTTFLETVRYCLKKHDVLLEHNEHNMGSEVVFGYRGKLYLMQGNFAINEYQDDFAATGSGREVCLGSLYSTSKLPTKDRVVMALEAASRYNAAVSAPYVILSMPR